MIIASLSDSARYEMLNPLFRRAFDFIREAAPAALEAGCHVLEEDALTVMVNEIGDEEAGKGPHGSA